MTSIFSYSRHERHYYYLRLLLPPPLTYTTLLVYTAHDERQNERCEIKKERIEI